MGLGRIFIFSLIFGVSISFAYRFGGDITSSGFSFYFLDSVFKSFGPGIQGLALLGSLVIGVVSIFSTAKVLRQIYENRGRGIIVSILGFVGAIFIILSPQGNFQVILLGIGMWVIGIVVIATNSKKILSNE